MGDSKEELQNLLENASKLEQYNSEESKIEFEEPNLSDNNNVDVYMLVKTRLEEEAHSRIDLEKSLKETNEALKEKEKDLNNSLKQTERKFNIFAIVITFLFICVIGICV